MPDELKAGLEGDVLGEDLEQGGQGVQPDQDLEAVQPSDQDLSGVFEGLPFQKVEDLVSAYKELTKSYAQGRIDYHDLKRQLSELTPLLQKMQPKESAHEPSEEEITNAIGDFFKKGPKAVFEGIIKPLQETLEGLKGETVTIRKERDLERFLNENAQLTDEDEQELVKIIQSTPRIRSMTSVYDQLDAAMDRLMRQEPTRFTSREKVGEVGEDLKEAKKGASQLGGKSGGKRVQEPKDEFDEVLEVNARQKARWN